MSLRIGLKEIGLLTKTILTENNRTAESKKGFFFCFIIGIYNLR